MIHKIPIRIYYEDTDAGGVVYHASYLRFAERGRTEFLRQAGFINSALHRDAGILFVVRHIDIEYVLPAHLDDLLELGTQITAMKNSSFVMVQKFTRTDGSENRANGQICAMKVTLVCVDSQSLKPVRLPNALRDIFQNYVCEEIDDGTKH